jgi:E3 ubiquitin-protein ligase TRIP12
MEQIDEWSEEDLLACLIPSNGYNRESPAFLHLVSVLARFGEFERRQFLQFVTAVPSLPPGGLKSLSPPIG